MSFEILVAFIVQFPAISICQFDGAEDALRFLGILCRLSIVLTKSSQETD